MLGRGLLYRISEFQDEAASLDNKHLNAMSSQNAYFVIY